MAAMFSPRHEFEHPPGDVEQVFTIVIITINNTTNNYTNVLINEAMMDFIDSLRNPERPADDGSQVFIIIIIMAINCIYYDIDYYDNCYY